MSEKIMNRFWSIGVVCALVVTFAVAGNVGAIQLDFDAIPSEILQLRELP